MDEAFDCWYIGKDAAPYGFQNYFKEWHERELTDMVLRDRNHPSVILWSIGNEIKEQWFPGKHTMEVKSPWELVGIIKKNDPTRFTTSAFNFVRDADKKGMTAAVDVVGFNYTIDAYDALRVYLRLGLVKSGCQSSCLLDQVGVDGLRLLRVEAVAEANHTLRLELAAQDDVHELRVSLRAEEPRSLTPPTAFWPWQTAQFALYSTAPSRPSPPAAAWSAAGRDSSGGAGGRVTPARPARRPPAAPVRR